MRKINPLKTHRILAEEGLQASDAKGWGLAGALVEAAGQQQNLQLLFRVAC